MRVSQPGNCSEEYNWLLSWISWHNLVLGHFLPLSLLAWCMRIGLHVVGVFSR